MSFCGHASGPSTPRAHPGPRTHGVVQLPNKILAFSVSHNHQSVRIYGHYPGDNWERH